MRKFKYFVLAMCILTIFCFVFACKNNNNDSKKQEDAKYFKTQPIPQNLEANGTSSVVFSVDLNEKDENATYNWTYSDSENGNFKNIQINPDVNPKISTNILTLNTKYAKQAKSSPSRYFVRCEITDKDNNKHISDTAALNITAPIVETFFNDRAASKTSLVSSDGTNNAEITIALQSTTSNSTFQWQYSKEENNNFETLEANNIPDFKYSGEDSKKLTIVPAAIEKGNPDKKFYFRCIVTPEDVNATAVSHLSLPYEVQFHAKGN